MKHKSVSQITADFAQDMKSLADRINHWHNEKEAFYPVLEKLDEIDGVTCSGGYGLSVRASGDGALLTLIVRALRTTGWYSEDDRPKKNSTHWWATFRRRSDSGTGTYYGPSINVSFSSTLCKQVKVGTEMREVAIYETQCEDLTIAEPLGKPDLTVVEGGKESGT
jgi:hypothetical protein